MNIHNSPIHFGMIASNKGFVSAAQVMKALEMQMKEQASTGSHCRIGTLLLEKGAITLAQLDEVL